MVWSQPVSSQSSRSRRGGLLRFEHPLVWVPLVLVQGFTLFNFTTLHYFPGVPFYRLPALQRALRPFYERKGMRWQTYGGLLYGWLIENHAPHTDWSRRDTGHTPTGERLPARGVT